MESEHGPPAGCAAERGHQVPLPQSPAAVAESDGAMPVAWATLGPNSAREPVEWYWVIDGCPYCLHRQHRHLAGPMGSPPWARLGRVQAPCRRGNYLLASKLLWALPDAERVKIVALPEFTLAEYHRATQVISLAEIRRRSPKAGPPWPWQEQANGWPVVNLN